MSLVKGKIDSTAFCISSFVIIASTLSARPDEMSVQPQQSVQLGDAMVQCRFTISPDISIADYMISVHKTKTEKSTSTNIGFSK
ncbi:hypothetical protein J6590_054806 [Homalodisca vitripennis]|nr:hypothetical protein J6590_054806 [Homalodisca vitripennis]